MNVTIASVYDTLQSDKVLQVEVFRRSHTGLVHLKSIDQQILGLQIQARRLPEVEGESEVELQKDVMYFPHLRTQNMSRP